MIVYHGTPFGGDRAGVARFLRGRHALIPFPRQEDCAIAFEVCQSVVFDNGAFSAWKQGGPILDWSAYYDWCREWHRHPAFAWAIIPDVIDGSEEDNDALIAEWPLAKHEGVPVCTYTSHLTNWNGLFSGRVFVLDHLASTPPRAQSRGCVGCVMRWKCFVMRMVGHDPKYTASAWQPRNTPVVIHLPRSTLRTWLKTLHCCLASACTRRPIVGNVLRSWQREWKHSKRRRSFGGM